MVLNAIRMINCSSKGSLILLLISVNSCLIFYADRESSRDGRGRKRMRNNINVCWTTEIKINLFLYISSRCAVGWMDAMKIGEKEKKEEDDEDGDLN